MTKLTPSPRSLDRKGKNEISGGGGGGEGGGGIGEGGGMGGVKDGDVDEGGARAVLGVAVARAMGVAFAAAVALMGAVARARWGVGKDESKGVDWWWQDRGCWQWRQQHSDGGG